MAKEAERALIGAVIKYPAVISQARTVGLQATDFASIQAQEWWRKFTDLHDKGKPMDVAIAATITGKTHDEIEALVATVPDLDALNVPEYAKLIVTDAIARRFAQLKTVHSESTRADLLAMQSEVESLLHRYVQMENSHVPNPADTLESSRGWSAPWGIDFLDKRIRLVSGARPHFLAGDPSSGKSAIAIQTATFNAMTSDHQVIYCATEDQVLDITMAMLVQTGKLSTYEANRLQYEPASRTRSNLAKLRALWDSELGDIPLVIHEVRSAAEVLTIVGAAPEQSLIILDHLYSLMMQTDSKKRNEHEKFAAFIGNLCTLCGRGEHIMLVLNQFTKAGRSNDERGPDAQYGGSVIGNAAVSMVHIQIPNSDQVCSSSGYMARTGSVVKAKALLVVDAGGNTVNPVGQSFQFFIHGKHRLAVSTLPLPTTG